MSTKLYVTITQNIGDSFNSLVVETIAATTIDELINKTLIALIILKNKEHEREIEELKSRINDNDIPF